ncbi:MAG: putative Ribokinase [Candidatus Berkelbacteria bacterium Licking1014_7]|uniref:Putative Ribokinase n=1 Tax=Candidatus Berkelbacteria bacterium Licking1014_7 TaxID=2017147 RepID=A0A554LHC3_9BACT|nr:MAG: putative Ribokinase [Candidatus Berkelbacteria bacterium Licking1014_7]
MFDFIFIGDSTLDVFLIVHEYKVMFDIKRENKYLCVSYADKVPVDEIREMIAGNAPNAAVAAGRAGLKIAIVTQMGDDKISEMARELFLKEGVALDYFVQEKGTQSNYSTVVAVDGERTILIYHTPRQYRLPNLVPAKWAYLTSMARGSEQIFPALVKYLKKTGAKLLYQPGTFQLRLGAEKSKELLEQTELFVVNRDEAILYVGAKLDIKIKDLIDKIKNLGPKMIVITDGTKGSYSWDGQNYWQMGILKDILRKEATGAGDAYASGLAIALCKGFDMPEAMRWAHFNSSSVIQFVGAQEGLLAESGYRKWSKKYKNFKAEKF